MSKAYDTQAVLLGWEKIPVVGAYLTPEGTLVVIDKEQNRYTAKGSRRDESVSTIASAPEETVPASWFLTKEDYTNTSSLGL